MKTKKILINVLLVISILCGQYGSSLLLSFGNICFVILIWVLKPKLNRYIIFIIILSIVLFCIALINFEVRHFESVNYARELRIFLLILFFIVGLNSELKLSNLGLLDIDSVLLCCSSVCVVFLCFQYSSYGNFFVVPKGFYANEANALASNAIERANDLGYDVRIRHSSFYSEPSYLALILCLFYYYNVNSVKSSKNSVTKFMIYVGVVLSTSALGYIGLFLINISNMINRQNWFKIIVLYSGIFVALYFTTEWWSENFIFDRLEKLSGKDESLNIRFLVPFELIYHNLSNYEFLGIPFSATIQYFFNLHFYDLDQDTPFHNSILNLIINYGILGVLFLHNIFFKFTEGVVEKILLVICLSQNGAFFTFNKVSLVLLLILLVRLKSSEKRKETNLTFGTSSCI